MGVKGLVFNLNLSLAAKSWEENASQVFQTPSWQLMFSLVVKTAAQILGHFLLGDKFGIELYIC